MIHYAVLTAIGEDRPGLVNAVSRVILQCGGNIEDSRMARLGGEFAMLILVSGEPDAVERLIEQAAAVGPRIGLMVNVRRTRAGERGATVAYDVSAHAMDHPGIVERVSHFLAERGISIRSMDTEVTHAPHTGQPLFALRARVDVGGSEALAELRRGLAAIGAEQNVEILVKPAEWTRPADRLSGESPLPSGA